MNELPTAAAGARPLIKRIVDFPLVAMLFALGAIMVPAGLVVALLAQMVPATSAAGALGQLVVVVVMLASYKLIVRHLGARKHDDLAWPGAAQQLGAGFGLGTLLFATIVGASALFGVYRLLGPGDASNLAGSIVRDGMFPAVGEEMIFRAILFRWIEELAGSWPALIISSVLFGLSHMANPGADIVSMVGIMLEGGVLLGGAYMLTRRLWFPMGIHASWNLTQGEVFDIPVSGNDAHGLVEAKLQGPALLTGGSFGLEGSVISITIATMAGILLVWLAVKRGQLRQSWWAERDGYRKL